MKKSNKILFVTNGLRDEASIINDVVCLLGDSITELTFMAISPPMMGRLKSYKKEFDEKLITELKKNYSDARGYKKEGRAEPHCSVNYEVMHTDQAVIEIIQKVLREEYDILIKQVEPSEKKQGYGSLDMKLLRKCPTPLWLMRPGRQSKRDHYENIAVAVDPVFDQDCAYNLSVSLLKHANSLTHEMSITPTEKKFDVVVCWQSDFEKVKDNPFIQVSNEDIDKDINDKKEVCIKTLNKMLKDAEVNSSYTIQMRYGDPIEIIPEYVKDNDIDILLMGTVARTGISGFIIGNTAENILNKLSCSVIALKPPGFVSPVKAY